MFAEIALTVGILLSSGAVTAAGEDSTDREFWDWLMVQAGAIDFDQFTNFRAVSAQLGLAASCGAMGEDELQDEYFNHAMAIDEKDKRRNYHSLFFEYAINTNQMQLAEEIVGDSHSSNLRDRLAIEKLRRGDRDAIKDDPLRKTTFSTAIGVARVLVELGDYDGVEEFVADLEIHDQNDPKDVAGLAFEMIAKRYREEGDMENAKRYIDKAMAIAGGQFFTGDIIDITHRSMHGVLTKNLDDFSRGAVAYGRGMGSAQVHVLVRELAQTGYFAEAKRTAAIMEKPADLHAALRTVANEQARSGDMTAALKTVEEFESDQAKNAARLGIAEVLAETGESDTARELADFVLRDMKQEVDDELERPYQRLAHLYGTFRCRPQIEQLITKAPTAMLKAECVLYAINGFAEAEAE